MGWILFGIVAVCAGIEALIGVKRGIAFGGLRLVLTAIGTVLAAVLAKVFTSMIVLKIAGAFGYSGKNLTEAAEAVLKSTPLQAASGTLAGVMAGIAVSFAVPVVFVAFFLVLKLLTFFIYLILKKVFSKASFAKVFTERPVWSKISGGILGGLVGIFAFAIVLSPIYGIINCINNSGSEKEIFSLMQNLASEDKQTAKTDFDEYLRKVAEFDEKTDNAVAFLLEGIIRARAAENESYSGKLGGISLQTIIDIYKSIKESPAVYVCRYTGAEATAFVIYKGASEVGAKTVGATENHTESYNFPELLSEVLENVEAIDKVIVIAKSEGGISAEMLNTVTDLADAVLEGKLLADEDKLDIVNAFVPMIQEEIGKALGIDDVSQMLGEFKDFDSFKSDVDNIIEMVEIVAKYADTSNPSKQSKPSETGEGNNTPGENITEGGTEIDVEALLKNSDDIKTFIKAVFKLSTGPETIATLVNSTVKDKTQGDLDNVTTPEMVRKAGEETLLELVDSLRDFTKYTYDSVISHEDALKLVDIFDDLAEKGYVFREAVDKVRVWLHLDE